MAHQLLWLEMLLRLATGLLLLVAPRTLVRLLGLPPADEPFWARLLGAVLLGLSVASILELRLDPGRSLGIVGSIAIDLTVAAVLGGLLILGRAGVTRRGRTILWGLALLLTLLGLVGIVSAA